MKYANDGEGLIVRLFNASDEAQSATVASALFHIDGAWVCDLFEHPLERLSTDGGNATITLPPRQSGTLLLKGRIAGKA